MSELKIVCLQSARMGSNCYLVYDEQSKRGFFVDAGCSHQTCLAEAQKLSVQAEALLLTHGHFDHIAGAAGLQKAGLSVYIGQKDAGMLSSDAHLGGHFGIPIEPLSADVALVGEERLVLAGIPVQVIATPGHTQGGMCYLVNNMVLFSGDTLFRGTVGRSDFPGGDANELLCSLRERILTLRREIRVLPGHDEETTVGTEADTNPYCRV